MFGSVLLSELSIDGGAFCGDWRDKKTGVVSSPQPEHLYFNENPRVFTGIYSLFVGSGILFGLQFHLQMARNLIFSK